MAWYYTFEAKEIQRYILQSDKLRDMVGGSELVNRLCGDFLDQALRSVGVTDPDGSVLARAAGWARITFDKEGEACNFYSRWPLLVNRFAPGLQVIQALAKQRSTLPCAMREGIEKLRAERNLSRPELPEAGPLVERSPRTGSAAVAMVNEREKKVPCDRQTLRKRENAKNHNSLTNKVCADLPPDAWPYEIDDIVKEASSYVAVIHADGNDLGATVMNIANHLSAVPEQAASIYRQFSEAIDEITIKAVNAAFDQVLRPDYQERLNKAKPEERKAVKIAARPVVLGGDDLTMIVRADLAMKFTQVFLEEFETGSRKVLAERLDIFGIARRPALLTACAGVAYVKKTYPFAASYHLAETLCDHTKRQAKADRQQRQAEYVPSSAAFYRLTASTAGGYGEIKNKELTGRDSTRRVRFWLGPYAVGGYAGGLPTLDRLNALSDAIAGLPSGAIRTLIGTMHISGANAAMDYGRVLQVADKKDADAFHSALIALTGNQKEPLWTEEGGHTPLLDAHILHAISKGGGDE